MLNAVTYRNVKKEKREKDINGFSGNTYRKNKKLLRF